VLLPKDIPLGQVATVVDPSNPLAHAGEITREQAVRALLRFAEQSPDTQLLPWLEREFTLHAMRVTNGNQVRAAKLLGITRATLRKRIEQFSITRETTVT
jgi:two-component system nitrogen regulation response regulator GlnG